MGDNWQQRVREAICVAMCPDDLPAWPPAVRALLRMEVEAALHGEGRRLALARWDAHADAAGLQDLVRLRSRQLAMIDAALAAMKRGQWHDGFD